MCRYDPQSFKYSFKYTLWDYLKALENYDVRQIANLGKLYAMLFASADLPLHFLKVLDFTDLDESLTKPQQLFLYLLFDQLLSLTTKEELKTLFMKSLYPKKQKKAKTLMKGLDEEESFDNSEAEDPAEEDKN